MTEHSTEATKYLQDRLSGEDKARQQRAVDKLLSLGHHQPRQQPLSDNPLVVHALRNAKI